MARKGAWARPINQLCVCVCGGGHVGALEFQSPTRGSSGVELLGVGLPQLRRHPILGMCMPYLGAGLPQLRGHQEQPELSRQHKRQRVDKDCGEARGVARVVQRHLRMVSTAFPNMVSTAFPNMVSTAPKNGKYV